jgi:cytochrome P450
MVGGGMRTQAKLPPGPAGPAAFQMIGFWARPIASMERARARYGKRFTVRLLGAPPFVIHSEPDHIKEILTAPPDVLHPGEGAKILEPIVGANSLILLDEDPHLEQRKLLLPALHGEHLEGLSGLVREVTEREVEGWPRDEPLVTHDRLADLTLEIILRAVFGLDPGPRLDELRRLLRGILEFSVTPVSMIPALQRNWFGRGPFAEFARIRARADELIRELVEERRAEGADRDDVLAMLLQARHDDGSPMSYQELRDELMTLLTAGHETTASQLTWAFAILARHPRVQEELAAEIDSGEGDEYLTATVREILRRRPVLPNAEPRLVKKEVEIGGWTFPPDVCLIANGYLLHHDPDIYPDPYSFRPERFVGVKPGTYTWIPFGGGRRRCIGAAFATLEMRTVLRAVFERYRVEPGADAPELTRRRAITISPARGGRSVLRERERAASKTAQVSEPVAV